MIVLPLFLLSFIFSSVFGGKKAVYNLFNSVGDFLGLEMILGTWGWVFNPDSDGS
jgi:hypothetical protein